MGPPFGARAPAVPLAGLLIALGLGFRKRFGWACCWLGAGALTVWSQPDSGGRCFERVSSNRPMEVVGERIETWRNNGSGWTSALQVRRIRQGTRIEGCDALLRLSSSAKTSPAADGQMRIKGFARRADAYRNGTRRYPARPPPRSWRMHLKSDRLWAPEPVARSWPSRRIGTRARGWLEAGFEGFGTQEGMAAARALVLGDRSAMSERTRRTLRRFGLSHLFAVSGLHVALVAMLVHALLRPLPRRLRIVAAGLAVVGYLIVVGARPSIVRATAMVLLGSFAVALDRPPQARQGLCLAAAGLVLLDPDLLFDLGYQLTVSASAGILWLAPRLADRWQTLPRAPRTALAATLGAQLGSLPWAAPAFSTLHPLAPLLNLVAIPWMACFGLASFVGVAAMRLLPGLEGVVAWAIDWGFEPLRWLERLPASPLWTFPTAMNFSQGLGLSASLAVALLSRSRTLGFAALVAALVLARGPALRGPAELVALDVGQGDAILLHDGRRTVLVDGGGWRRGDLAASVTLPALARLGVRRLDAVVVTHPDIDHCRGVADLAAYIPIGRLLTGPGQSRSPCVRELAQGARRRWRTVWRGERIVIGRIELDVLHPAPGSLARGNDSSLVVRAAVAGSTVLLTGDLEASGEARLLSSVEPGRLQSRILKVPHHGSRTSTTERFLRVVMPSVAVVSAGRSNRYGHPAPPVIDRLLRHGIRVVRTDRDGMVRLALEPLGRPAGVGSR